MYRYLKTSDKIYAMSNMVGEFLKIDGPLPFSFYFGTKDVFSTQNKHGIRVKICPNSAKYPPNNTSEFELHGQYKLHDTLRIKSDLEKHARTFFKKYKVLFAGVWESVLLEENVVGYFKDRASLQDIIEESYLSEEQQRILDGVQTVQEFETLVRRYKMFNMND
jgi:hypothetical protein